MATFLDEEARKLLATYPRFDDDRVNYSGQRICYAVICVVVAEGKILLVRRGKNLSHYAGLLDVVSGYLDRVDWSIEESGENELREELDAPFEDLKEFKFVGELTFVDEKVNREWRDYYLLAEFKEQFAPRLNWENSEAKWYDPAELKNLQDQMIPGFYDRLKKLLPEIFP